MIGDSVILAKDCNHNPLTGAILKINHAINICGWGTTVQNGKNVDYWIIQNSWGSSWGNKGFGKVERQANGFGGCLVQQLIMSPNNCEALR